MPRFEGLASSVARTVLTIEPFRNYSHYVNVHRITVLEAKSGIASGATRLGAHVKPGGILTCDRAKAREYGKLAPDADLVIVCVNVKEQVRATGLAGVMTVDASGDFNDTVLHELGHAYADLDDEYVDAAAAKDFPEWGEDQELRHLNVTRQPSARLAKWHYWMLPPSLPEDQRVGCIPGAYYHASGY